MVSLSNPGTVHSVKMQIFNLLRIALYVSYKPDRWQTKALSFLRPPVDKGSRQL